MRNSLLVVAAILFLAPACQQSEAPEHPPTTPPSAPPAAGPGELPAGHPPIGGLPSGHPPLEESAPKPAARAALPLTWTVPEGWTSETPSSSMRVAQFHPGGEGAGDVRCIVFGGIGGSNEENIERWVAQFAQPDGSDPASQAKFTHDEHDGVKVTRVDVAGTFTGQMMAGVGDPVNAEDWRFLGAIAEGHGARVFLTFRGPRAVIDPAEAGFDALLASFRGP